jgi:hypothetical protein
LPGMEGSAMPYLRAIRQPRLRWIGPQPNYFLLKNA